MFRIEYLKLKDHKQLGNVELFLSDLEEMNNDVKPYSSVIIGPNGTGKSFILRSISDIFSQLAAGQKKLNFSYGLHLRYKLNDDYFEVINTIILLNGATQSRIFKFYKNRPHDENSPHGFGFLNRKYDEYSIDIQNLILPNHVIVSSVMLNDRFLFKKSKSEDFYQYLGVRATSSTASTKSAVKGVINKLFSESITNQNFLTNLKELLSFLEFENKFQVEYNTKINKLFFSGNLTVSDFKQYYEYWWDTKFKYSNRGEKTPIWSKPFYDKFYKPYDDKINDIVNYLNEVTKSGRLQHKYNSTSKLLNVDFFDSQINENELRKIIDLEKLDIINVNGINLNKNKSNINISDISSGEYHLLISLIGIFSKIEDNSLVLIDEPEISLHPNWQMQYITFLKKVFSKCASCHFIITSHSHFIVSDLEGDSSSVTSLNRNIETNKLESTLIDLNTYGWSAEDVLYNVFNVRSTWNYFLEADLTELLGLISINSNDTEKIKVLVNKFERLPTRDNDPLQEIITEAKNYLKTQ